MKIPFQLLALASTTRAFVVQRSSTTGSSAMMAMMSGRHGGAAATATTFRHLSMASNADGDIQTGTVKWFDVKKGFGFIVPDNAGAGGDIFVHQTAIQSDGFRSLAEGEAVEYVVEEDAKTGRSKAMQVTGPNGSDVQGQPFNPSNDFDSY